MKSTVLAFVLLCFSSLLFAQKNTGNSLQKRIKAIEDRLAIKNIVDTFSVLADVKNTDAQELLFTEDAIVQTIQNGQPAGAGYKGRKEIGNAFKNFLNLFETVYHLNGQQTLTLNGTRASGISYCQVTLIGNENGRKMKTTLGIYYHDEYVKQNGKWLIEKRQSNFTWTDKRELTQ